MSLHGMKISHARDSFVEQAASSQHVMLGSSHIMKYQTLRPRVTAFSDSHQAFLANL